MKDEQVSGPDQGENAEDNSGLTRGQAVGAAAAAVAGLSVGGLVGPALAAASSGPNTFTDPLEERIENAVETLSLNPGMINKLLPHSVAKPAVLKKLQLSDVKHRYDPQVHQQLMTMMIDAVQPPGGTPTGADGGERLVEWVAAIATLAAGALAA